MAKTIIYLWLARQSIMCLQQKLLFYPGNWTEENKISGRSWLEKAWEFNSAWSTDGAPKGKVQDSCSCLGMGDTLFVVLCWS